MAAIVGRTRTAIFSAPAYHRCSGMGHGRTDAEMFAACIAASLLGAHGPTYRTEVLGSA